MYKEVYTTIKYLPIKIGLRGVVRAQWGEGITGTTRKDTWTKSRGRVEAVMGRKGRQL